MACDICVWSELLVIVGSVLFVLCVFVCVSGQVVWVCDCCVDWLVCARDCCDVHGGAMCALPGGAVRGDCSARLQCLHVGGCPTWAAHGLRGERVVESIQVQGFETAHAASGYVASQGP